MKGFIGHTDQSWWQFLRGEAGAQEVNFWRPGGRGFSALQPGEPFFFRLKSPINRIGGFGLFARAERLPVWRAWEVFGRLNGVSDESDFLLRLERLARRPVTHEDLIGCVAIVDCTLFDADDWVTVPDSFRPQNLSGSLIDLTVGGGRELWEACLKRAAKVPVAPAWAEEMLERQQMGKPQTILPRLGQGSFRLGVLDAYGACAVTGEQTLPALEAAHIRPWSAGGGHALSNGLALRRDLHRLFDLGYVSVSSNGQFLISPQLRTEFSGGGTYYALEGRSIQMPKDPSARPSPALLDWHSQAVFRTS